MASSYCHSVPWASTDKHPTSFCCCCFLFVWDKVLSRPNWPWILCEVGDDLEPILLSALWVCWGGVGLHMHENANVSEGQKRVSDPLELQAFVSCPIWVLIIELGSSTRAVVLLDADPPLQQQSWMSDFHVSTSHVLICVVLGIEPQVSCMWNYMLSPKTWPLFLGIMI